MSKEIPVLIEAIKNAIEGALIDLNVCLPATVLSFDKKKQTCSVQPSIKAKFLDGTVVSLPVITDVPVQFPRVKKGGLKFPLAKDDQGMIVVSQRSLDVWKAKGGTVDPQEGRKFNLSDAFFIPGAYSPGKPDGSFPGEDLEVVWGSSKITMKEGGKVLFSGGSEELFQILSDLSNACSQIANSSGPTFNAAAFTAIKARVDAMKG